MTGITVKELLEATGGNLLLGQEDQHAGHISLDSRKMEGDDLFVPIVGERVDAHRFLCQAIASGAAAVFTSEHHRWEDVKASVRQQCGGNREQEKKALGAAWIEVPDTKRALQDLGSFCRKRLTLPLVGITGSVGKTTTREMIAEALSAGFLVYKTPGNSNSQVGVPITIAEIPQSAEIGVIELGMSEPGEMERISRVARVDCAVMTNIGVAHIEQLGSQEHILEEKLHIQDGMPAEGILFLNGDDPLLASVVPKEGRKKVLYGLGRDCDYRAEDLHLEEGYPVFTAVHGDRSVRVRLQVMGSHMVSNAMAALAVADTYGLSMEKAALALGQFKGYKGRQQIFQWGGVTVIDDSYNASPVSMKAGLEVLASVKGEGRRIAVLADMKELGLEAVRFHEEIGAYIGEHPLDMVLLLGELASCIGSGMDAARAVTPHIEMDRLAQVEEWLDEHIKEGDCILFKGSNSMKLSEAVRHLKEARA
ncbi:UDP-N-acetylmuramoyl-tripeptide--D-alanyl-D-alanine ligase [Enterocloster clostridioformis]|uniref:UDP-N-acetylmuramoyl-tripeptide--D-alanyl-D- alanine ligase n=1 Tax=Enterocloster clostridioformis TaxID=1531 RepID=UPI00080C4E19|nr:UDP-N-acetylmuramoyl-tripeptide--D-alanyl-D-alanine ligase [Enterocloster clostridioformis]ANU44882.1 UDP-N-acetylmuramoylalanyl-D-glutamyl-2, 6-diaminopimelate--D-alanyl-D-alanine ligase [Lachnoclostridium sp. YL32]NDO27749.1 UDP-N-acetylmuramoyl-tripeptide--D-alanyl-D-alanine ligase [Enterocloster clostridioformis]OXE70212.1 UDP-N-acetylmuramoyl-tripeptide--D-alanyl-D-alanine ligase [Enterocloster clostridioformis]QQR00359.1 UDP-N-acetylmuramoyl-tripeptide--D-alanyl-D-alanine ligase [Enter